jgi:hypothetical protein
MRRPAARCRVWPCLDAVPAAQREAVTGLVSYALVAWRDALCAEVAAVDGVCVDVYAAFEAQLAS